MNIEIIKADAVCWFSSLFLERSPHLSHSFTQFSLCVSFSNPPPSSHPSPPSFLLASRTLKSLHGAAPSLSNESVCCHFSDARCEIKRAVYVRAVAGIKCWAHIGRRQLLQSLQAHIYVPFVQFAICRTKPIFQPVSRHLKKSDFFPYVVLIRIPPPCHLLPPHADKWSHGTQGGGGVVRRGKHTQSVFMQPVNIFNDPSFMLYTLPL